MLTPVIGLEIHVELRTNSKMFCGCPAYHFDQVPNTHTCPVCLGLPGALPVPNKKAVDWTIMIGQALGCDIATDSKFDRKHYFYPDLPKGYQISQYDEPLCVHGLVKTSFGDVIITRVHLEEDTAKLQHLSIKGEKVSLIDFNRSGVPLVEIVTEPDIKSASQAKEYAQKIRNIVQFLGVSDGDLEKGSMRLEANISLGLDLGYKVEVKNINSFKFLEKSIDYELKRQRQLLESGTTPKQETRGFSASNNETFSQRSKETAEDYRYFPEPDIPPMHFTKAAISHITQTMSKLPQTYFEEFTKEYDIRADYAELLTEHRKLAEKSLETFQLTHESEISPGDVANWLINKKFQTENLKPPEIIALIQKSASKPTASSHELESWVQEAIKTNPDVVAKFHTGKTNVLGALIGDVMRRSKGQANPKTTKELLLAKLSR